MEVLNSLLDFLWGVSKRIWILLPSLVLDPFDIAQKVFNWNYPVPQGLAWLLFGLSCATAIFLTYHDLRKRKVALEKQLSLRGEQYVDEKRREWWQSDIQSAKLYISAPDKRSLIESIRNEYAESDNISYVKAVMDDNHTLWHYIDLIVNFFQNVEIDLTRHRSNTSMKKLINAYLGKDIIHFYELIGFYEDVTIKYWKSRGRTEEPHFERLYNEMKMLSQSE